MSNENVRNVSDSGSHSGLQTTITANDFTGSSQMFAKQSELARAHICLSKTWILHAWLLDQAAAKRGRPCLASPSSCHCGLKQNHLNKLAFAISPTVSRRGTGGFAYVAHFHAPSGNAQDAKPKPFLCDPMHPWIGFYQSVPDSSGKAALINLTRPVLGLLATAKLCTFDQSVEKYVLDSSCPLCAKQALALKTGAPKTKKKNTWAPRKKTVRSIREGGNHKIVNANDRCARADHTALDAPVRLRAENAAAGNASVRTKTEPGVVVQ